MMTGGSHEVKWGVHLHVRDKRVALAAASRDEGCCSSWLYHRCRS